MIVQRLSGYSIHADYTWLAAGQLSDCCPHAFCIRLAVKPGQPSLAPKLYGNNDPLCQSSSFFDSPGPHQAVFTAQHSFYGRRDMRRVPRRLADDGLRIELVKKSQRRGVKVVEFRLGVDGRV